MIERLKKLERNCEGVVEERQKERAPTKFVIDIERVQLGDQTLVLLEIMTFFGGSLRLRNGVNRVGSKGNLSCMFISSLKFIAYR